MPRYVIKKKPDTVFLELCSFRKHFLRFLTMFCCPLSQRDTGGRVPVCNADKTPEEKATGFLSFTKTFTLIASSLYPKQSQGHAFITRAE